MESVPLTWEEVARVYGRKIYNFAYRLTGNPDDAHDLVQEVLIRVRRGLASYQPGSFEGWLWRITRNAFLDDIRRQKRRPTTPLPDDVDRWDRASTESADSEYARISLGDDIQKALLQLPIDFREAVVLCDVVGLSYEEIAQACAVPIGTVRSRIHRGRKMLKETLQ
jgi:RNA polymerase sigma-70 factor (ECF subfamily)